MTYFGVLAGFVIPPTLILMLLVPRDIWHRLLRGQVRVYWAPYLAVLLHVLLALVYTTPWDNYLVATNVWWYDSDLVTGITIGWVPIEEYTFFVVQTLLTGLWTLTLIRFALNSRPSGDLRRGFRRQATVVVIALWLISTAFLLLGPESGRYLTLILTWALIPVLIQVAFGADILLANWRLLAAAILVPTIYLWLVDALAIQSGTWTINPAQTTGAKLGPLPLEEMVFFLMTNLLIGFGVTLMLSEETKERAQAIATWLKRSTGRLRRSSAAGY